MLGQHRTLRVRAAIWWLPVILVLLTACLPTQEDYSSQSQLLGALERKSGLIAYVGADGNIYTANQAGAKKTAITNDADLTAGTDSEEAARFYLFPTWSPDSESLAFMGVTGSASNPVETTIHTAGIDGSDLSEVYRSENSRPVFLYWSPDGAKVSFLSSTPSGGLLLQLVNARGGEARVLDAGQPFYWAWAPDSGRLLIHSGGGTAGGRLSFLNPEERVLEEMLELRPSLFQAPYWSPDGAKMVMATLNEAGEGELVVTDVQSGVPRKLVGLGERRVAFAGSPDGQKIAFVASDPGQTQGVIGLMTVIDIEQPDVVTAVEEEQVFAFFWAPNSEKLAYFVPARVALSSGSSGNSNSSDDGTILVLSLHVLDVDSGKSERLTVFRPTPEMLSILPFFDQYHHSATIWSPDSQNIVVTAVGAAERRQVMVINASGELDPRPIADGVMAFWSWE